MDESFASLARDRCAIAGIGQTEYSRNSGRSVLALASEAAQAAAADAGLALSEIDAIIGCTEDDIRPATLAATLGVPELTYLAEAGPGGVGPCMMIGIAIGALLTGQARAVLAFRSLNGRSEARFGSGVPGGQAPRIGGRSTYDEFYLPWGLTTAGQHFALVAHRHMLEFGTRPEHLGAVAMTCRAAANHNPRAQMHGRPMDLDAYMAAPLIAAPLRLFDFCLETDGAAAIVITTADRARDLAKRPVLVSGVASGLPPEARGGMMFPSLSRDMTRLGGEQAARKLWSRAGFGPGEVDVAQIYDCFSIAVILQLEAFGFCERGQGGPFAASGVIGKDGALPINTGGGHLSEGYLHGMNHIVEGVRQLRGEAAMQIVGAETALCTGGPFPVGTCVALKRGG